MSITFGGLATGLDTNTIVSELMALERRPLTTLQIDKAWFEKRQAAYATFDGKLNSFLSSIEKLGSSDDLKQKSVSTSSDEFFSVTAGADALAGASYQVEVVSLAQVQKNVSQGYADKVRKVLEPANSHSVLGIMILSPLPSTIQTTPLKESCRQSMMLIPG